MSNQAIPEQARSVVSATADQLARVIDRNLPVALLDFPDHSNCGDSAIWAGEVKYLRDSGCDVRYVCDADSFRESVLRARMPFGQLLLHGGGNFGTVWPRYQLFREAVIERFHDFRIVQLPQTLFFADRVSLDRTRHRLIRHPDFLLMVRDKRSEAFARDTLNVRTVLCPDSALLLYGTLERTPPQVDVLVLGRTDSEAQGSGLHELALPGFTVKCKDWLQEDRSVVMRVAGVLKRLAKTQIGKIGKFQSLQQLVFQKLADERVNRGVQDLCLGKIVVTDRLHAHILCMMLGIPHVVLDNNYGKLSQFISCWHSDAPLVRIVSTISDAAIAAKDLLSSPQPLERTQVSSLPVSESPEASA